MPVIDYASKDYQGLRTALLAAATDPTSPLYIAGWSANRSANNENDFGVTLVELFAMMGDILSWYGDRLADETFLATATQRRSVLAIAKMLGYKPISNVASTTSLTFTVAAGTGTVTIPAGTQVATGFDVDQDTPLIFETNADLVITQNAGLQESGTVAATQGETISNETLGTATPQPDQSFRLFHTPVIEGSVSVSVNGTPWAYVPYLIDYGPTDQVYTTDIDEFGNYSIVFGDGVNGQIPASGATVTASYRIGGGTQGNVAANTITQPVLVLPSVVSVTNPAAATGGADAETTEHIRSNAPRAYRTQSRAVSLKDYVDLTLQVPGVARVNAASATPGSIVLYVAPNAGGAPDTTLVNAINAFYDETRKMAGTTITVVPPVYTPVVVGSPDSPVQVYVLAQYNRAAVQQAVVKAVTDLLSFPNTDFGQRLTLSKVYHHTIQNVPGVDYVVVPVLARQSDPAPGAGDLTFASNEIPVLGSISVSSTGGIG